MRLSLLGAGLSICIAACVSQSASADVVAKLDSMPYKAVVRIHAQSGERSINESVYAGIFKWQGVAANPEPQRGTFYSFCIDIKDHVNIGSTYTYEVRDLNLAPISNGTGSGINSDLDGGMAATKAHLIQKLWAAKYALINSNTAAAAFQLAVWNIVYETQQDWTVSSGKFSVDSCTSANMANLWLSDLHNGGLTDETHLMAISSERYQDQVVVGAPVPAAVWSGLALLGMVGAMRVRRQWLKA